MHTLRAKPVIAVMLAALLCTSPASAGQVGGMPPDTRFTLERTGCFGSCASYTVTLDSTGLVVFDGHSNVRVPGRQTARVPAARVADLLVLASVANFFALEERYTANVSDLPHTFVTVTSGGRTKRIDDYVGAPEALRELEQAIDDTARTKRWIFYDAATVRELARGGWKPRNAEGFDLLTRAAREDDVALMRAFLSLGVRPERTGDMPGTVLSAVRSAEAVELLLEAGARPDGPGRRGAPLFHTVRSATGEATRALLEAGASPDIANADGRTPLWYAAISGNVVATRLLLDAGADPTTREKGPNAKPLVEVVRSEQAMWAHADSFVPRIYILHFVRDFDGVVALLEAALGARGAR